MTFYEELGVPQDAPLDTIREAYRNVARLLHPDAQTNPTLKESAEAQMKRINQLYATLSDPDRRRRYDEELVGPAEQPAAVVIHTPPGGQQYEASRGGNAVWVAATIICATFIIWLGSRDPTPVPVADPLPQLTSQVASQVTGGSSPPMHSDSRAVRSPDTNEIARLRGELAAVYADRERVAKQLAVVESQRASQSGAISALAIAPVSPTLQAAPSIAVRMEAPELIRAEPIRAEPIRKGWSGSWIYHAVRTENKAKSLFPPEFIQAVISDDNGWVHGQYHGRFKVSDPNISPEVSFHFEGRISGKDGRLNWMGVDGARGDVELRLISDTSLEMKWSASSLGNSMGLASGTAVLERKD